jgi:hypothetical protein
MPSQSPLAEASKPITTGSWIAQLQSRGLR